MSTRNLLDQIQVKSPCPADWDSMIGNDQVRFCEHCNLTVHNLSQMTRKRALRLVTESKGRLCVRYHRPSIVPQKLHQIGRRASRFAASAFTATLTVSAAVAQPAGNQSPIACESSIATVALGMFPEFKSASGARIDGTIFDANGALIAGATVTLVNEEGRYTRTTNSDDEGQYKFELLDPGTYSLTIEATSFTRSEVTQIVLGDNDSRTIDQTLQVGGITATVGMMVVAEPADPLIRAAQQDDLQAVLALLTSSNANLRDAETGTTALEYAVRNGDREMVQLLLAAGADANDRNSVGQTVLMMLGEEATGDIVWDLINAGAKVNSKDSDGDTALIEAARCHNLGVINALLQAGAKVETRNEQGQTALIMAASNGQTANVKALIAASADLNARDNVGKTVLDYAKENDQQRVIKVLQSHGALEGDVDGEN